MDQIKLAVNKSGFANSIDDNVIVPKDELGADIDTEVEPSVDVGDMAGNQHLVTLNRVIMANIFVNAHRQEQIQEIML